MSRRWRLPAVIGGALFAWFVLAGSIAAAGPPYPAPVTGQRVYDYAGVFSASARSQAEQVIRTIEDRTGAQIAVYTQVKPESNTLEEANADALALMNQWGVGRKGYDDGLVILFDMQGNLRHGQVSLYAGSGFKAAYLTNSDRQAIFDNDMMPRLKNADFDGALAIVLNDVDKAATPEHRDSLNQARQLNAIVGLGGFGIAIVLAFYMLLAWYWFGRDPGYTTDSSVLMPAPPDGLTPAMATLLIDDKVTSRSVSAAMVDLAARGLIRFRQVDKMIFGHATEIGATDQVTPLTSPEDNLASKILVYSGSGGYIGHGDKSALRAVGKGVAQFRSDLQDEAVRHRWFKGKPSTVILLWCIPAIAEFIVAGILISWTLQLDASGGILGAAGLIATGLATLGLAKLMPSRTVEGSALRAWLLAYKRTLEYTARQSGSMRELVERRPLPWVTTPDATMAWGVAFGLEHEIEAVLKRGLETMQTSGAPVGWYPMWWSTPGHSGIGGFAGGSTPGLYSAGMIPDVGSMVSAISSIGSTSAGGGGGSFGGGGGGGGGGAGGGF